MGSGGGFVDIDGDGWLDVILVGGGSLPSRPQQDVPALAVYKNLGIGADGALDFEEVTLQSGLDGIRAYGFGITAADYDNDGDPDILLTTLEQNLFFLNENGTFREISEAAGLSDPGVWSTSALFFDANKDGHPDLYIANYLQWSPESDIPCTPTGKRDYCNPLNYPGLEDTYYQNNGDGTFTNRTIDAGFVDAREGKGLGVTELDYNNDGWPDLYVANDGQGRTSYTKTTRTERSPKLVSPVEWRSTKTAPRVPAWEWMQVSLTARAIQVSSSAIFLRRWWASGAILIMSCLLTVRRYQK